MSSQPLRSYEGQSSVTWEECGGLARNAAIPEAQRNCSAMSTAELSTNDALTRHFPVDRRPWLLRHMKTRMPNSHGR